MNNRFNIAIMMCIITSSFMVFFAFMTLICRNSFCEELWEKAVVPILLIMFAEIIYFAILRMSRAGKFCSGDMTSEWFAFAPLDNKGRFLYFWTFLLYLIGNSS